MISVRDVINTISNLNNRNDSQIENNDSSTNCGWGQQEEPVTQDE